MDKELKHCPFCGGENITINNFDVKNSRWVLDHFCPYDKELEITISVYGNSREEVIEKWNKRIGE